MGTNSGLGGGSWANGAAGAGGSGAGLSGTGPSGTGPSSIDTDAGAGVRIGVVTFPGSLDDRDAARAVRMIGAEAVPLWHGTHDLEGCDAVILPGGFSYGDYLRAGAIASLSPIMSEVIDAANLGLPVLGICNGFQMLTEAHLLPGGLIRNDHGNFICRDQRLRVENTSTAWTNAFPSDAEITVPLKNGEGGFIASADEIARLEDEGRVVFRYLEVNPNGSMNDIAGITNDRGNVVGLMPHPEHAVEPGFGPDTALAMRSGTDGLALFTSVLSSLLARA
ncbi:MAG: phosphoribosylformylglycinamidine synthase [Subtercola sp.]|jgi:phosphoribosylformylglycinamidine synthase I|nr:phosphoribosylformylglycinamidine synthase [Subtercola sp.]